LVVLIWLAEFWKDFMINMRLDELPIRIK